MENQRPGSQKLPGLANMLNSPEDNRDSAYYSGNDASSKHTSTGSGMGVLSPAGSSFHTPPIDKTPSPTTANNLLPQPLVSPVNSNMSVSSMISPTTPGSFHRPQSYESAPSSATFAINGDIPEAMSRRESVDGRINQGFGNMQLGNSHSPYASHNHSTTSIQNTLQQQRNPRPGFDSLAQHRISNGYQPSAERNPEGQPRMQRVAPAITGPTTSHIARAAEPTKGQAWAFPEEEIKIVPSNSNSQYLDSRRSSMASLASSAYTTESRLPPGQRRLDESHEFQRLSNVSGEFPLAHHHSLQPRQVEDLRDEEVGSHAGGQPYSRTPELRVSHKLAERKRRTEMKELFEQLRQLQPQERGSKASKWEILTKAIAEHHRQQDQITSLQQSLQQFNGNHGHEIKMLRNENEQLKHEMASLRMELERMRSGGQTMNEPYVGEHYTRRPELARPEQLPPLRGLHTSQNGGPESMAGVQYEPRVNGYRNPDPSGRF
ncbi:protein esc1 [Rhypophila sp. PSN 637]